MRREPGGLGGLHGGAREASQTPRGGVTAQGTWASGGACRRCYREGPSRRHRLSGQVYLKARAEGGGSAEEPVSQLKSEVRHIQEVTNVRGGLQPRVPPGDGSHR